MAGSQVHIKTAFQNCWGRCPVRDPMIFFDKDKQFKGAECRHIELCKHIASVIERGCSEDEQQE